MKSVFAEVLTQLRQKRNMDLRGYRDDLLLKRLVDRIQQLRLTDPNMYLERLRNDPEETDRLIDLFVIPVSMFFRDSIVFAILAQTVLPKMFAEKHQQGKKEIRIWSAGCSTGEEAYSIAILLDQACKQMGQPGHTIHIFATDINQNVIKKARIGIYPREQFKWTQLEVMDNYFRRTPEGYKVRPFLRKMVRFSQDDLTSPERIAPAESVFGTFDLIFCRNVLIYFSRELQDRVLDKLYKALDIGGCLILGDAESLNQRLEDKFKPVNLRNRIFHKQV